MSYAIINNRNRQEDEVLALSSIYTYNEFSYCKEDVIQCYYNVFPISDSNNFLKLENIYENLNFHLFSDYFVKYLPPIRVYFQLPLDYPTKNSPNFYITVPWLSPWQISLICQKLDEIWLCNKGQEILFLWCEFLRTDILKFLAIKDTLDISFMHMTYCNISDYFKLNSTFQNDIRAIYSISFFNPVQFLINYDKYQQQIEFENNYFICTICFDEYNGKHCIKLNICNHIYCKNCIHNYIAIKINENSVNDILCPNLNCNINITYNNIKEFCPELLVKYENTLLDMTLRAMKDVVFCPRNSCQCPLVKDNNDNLAICSKCKYTFCIYCCKVYHGIEPCAMTSSNKQMLIEEYKNSNENQKKLLAKKYGRRQIQTVVEKCLTEEYLRKCAKPCPNCLTMIEKIDGCNKITCTYCKAYFCWVCGTHITTENAYDHFLTINSSCYKRLFQEEGEENVQP